MDTGEYLREPGFVQSALERRRWSISSDDFDSISQRSGFSSVVESAIGISRVERYERQNTELLETPPAQASNNQINFQINVVNSGQENSTRTVDDIFEKIISLPVQTQNLSNKRYCNAKALSLLLAILAVAIGLAVGLSIYLIKSQDKNNLETPPGSTVSQPITSTESTSETTSTTPTTTDFPKTYEYVNRTSWNAAEPVPVEPETLDQPVKGIVVLDTQSETCSDLESCKEFVKNRQADAIGSRFRGFDINDIRENFLIAPDGTIFEGTDLKNEGQHTYDDCKTSYNHFFGISFIGNYTAENLTQFQESAFNSFVKCQVEKELLDPEYKLFYHEQLSGLMETSDGLLSQNVKTWSNWRETLKNFIRKNDWLRVLETGSKVIFNKNNKTVTVSHSGTSIESCSDKSHLNCTEVLRDIHNSSIGGINYNFIMAGRNLIYELRGFDISHPNKNGLEILFIGNFTDVPPPETLMESFKEFLQYAIDLRKLEKDFELSGEKLIVDNVDEID